MDCSNNTSSSGKHLVYFAGVDTLKTSWTKVRTELLPVPLPTAPLVEVRIYSTKEIWCTCLGGLQADCK